jgi:hypothetical protein
LRPWAAPARAAGPFAGEFAMVAIGVILIFLVAFGALNYFEFGRLD